MEYTQALGCFESRRCYVRTWKSLETARHQSLACSAKQASRAPQLQTLQRCSHRDTYLEQQETEKIETECTLAVQGGILGKHTVRALQSVINICYLPELSAIPLLNEDLPAGSQLVFTLNK